jgi:hypothetical protein
MSKTQPIQISVQRLAIQITAFRGFPPSLRVNARKYFNLSHSLSHPSEFISYYYAKIQLRIISVTDSVVCINISNAHA